MIEDEVAHIHALATDPQHIRRNALRIAGSLLQAMHEEVIQREMERVYDMLTKEDIAEASPLYQAYGEMIERVASEVVKIGRELSQQAK